MAANALIAYGNMPWACALYTLPRCAAPARGCCAQICNVKLFCDETVWRLPVILRLQFFFQIFSQGHWLPGLCSIIFGTGSLVLLARSPAGHPAAGANCVDRAVFESTQTLSAVKLPGDGAYRLRQVPGVLPLCLRARKDRGIQNVLTEKHGACDRGFSLLLLGPNVSTEALPQQVQEAVQAHHGTFTTYQLRLSYDSFDYKESLTRLLPAHIAVPMGYEVIGHVAHFNLLWEHWPHRRLIGQAGPVANPGSLQVMDLLWTCLNA